MLEVYNAFCYDKMVICTIATWYMYHVVMVQMTIFLVQCAKKWEIVRCYRQQWYIKIWIPISRLHPYRLGNMLDSFLVWKSISGCSVYESPFIKSYLLRKKEPWLVRLLEKLSKNGTVIKKMLLYIIKTKRISKKGAHRHCIRTYFFK